MLRWLALIALVPAAALGSSVLRANAQSTHFSRTVTTVMGLTADGRTPDERGWLQRTRAELGGQVAALEAALPRWRNELPAARALVPLGSPGAQPLELDLFGDRAVVFDAAAASKLSPEELKALTRAMAAELGIKPPRRGIGWTWGALAVGAAVGFVAIVVLLVRRAKRKRQAAVA